MNLVMGLRSVVEPQEVKKTWVNRECLFADVETVSNKLATLGIKHFDRIRQQLLSNRA